MFLTILDLTRRPVGLLANRPQPTLDAIAGDNHRIRPSCKQQHVLNTRLHTLGEPGYLCDNYLN